MGDFEFVAISLCVTGAARRCVLFKLRGRRSSLAPFAHFGADFGADFGGVFGDVLAVLLGQDLALSSWEGDAFGAGDVLGAAFAFAFGGYLWGFCGCLG